MASASVVLDIRANTQKALSEFKKFSSQLDNKFLVSGLKLDVVRSSLSQINKEFQKAIGEQGIAAGSSIRAAENQAALLTQTFKNFSAEASLDLQTQFSKAFSEIAVKAGGTGEDIQRALSATPFISTSLSKDLRDQLGEGIIGFQTDLRRAGVAEDFGNIAKQFLSGEIKPEELVEQSGAAGAFIGRKLQELGIDRGVYLTPLERSQALLEIVSDPEISAQLKTMAERASGFKIVLENLFTYLFNPDAGVFGSFKEIETLIDGQLVRTNIFKETYSLINTIFDPREGLFVSFFKRVGEVFGIKDPLDIIIRGIRFITTQFERLKEFVNSPEFQAIVTTIRGAFDTIKNWAIETFGKIQQDFEDPDGVTNKIGQIGKSIFRFFKSILDTINAGDWSPERIVTSIREIGQNVRGFIRDIGEQFRSADLSKEGNFAMEILGTLVQEVSRTIGSVISEGIKTLFSGKGVAILAGVVGLINEGIKGLFSEIFGDGAGSIIGAIGTVGVVAIFAKKFKDGLLGVVNNVLGALPGGNFIKNKIQKFLGSWDGGVEGTSKTRRGSMNVFEKAVLTYLRAIQRCVCGSSGLGDLTGDSRRRKPGARDPITGRRYPKYTPGSRADLPDPGDIPDLPDSERRRSRRPGVRRRYIRSRIGGFTRGLTSRVGNFIDADDFRGIISTEADSAVSGRVDRGRGNTAARFNRRFGSGGTRAVLGKGIRGFGKGALIAGALSLGAGALFGGDAQASEFDPMTGQPVQRKTGAGEAFGKLGLGAAEGAMTGMMFGPWGAAIGAVIGGGLALMDKGVRDSIGKFISDSASNLMRLGGDLVDGLKKNVLGAFDSLKNLASGIDWKGLLIRTLIPGGDFTIKGLQGLAEFASKLNIFDGIKSGIDKISGFVNNIWNRVKAANPLRIFGLGGDGENNYNGANYYGPALAQEGRMSAGKPLVVNSREFVIPSDGFSTLANMVENRLNSGSNQMVNMSPTINLTINATGMSGDDIAEAIRNPVINIVNEAWERATSGTVTRGALA